MLHTLFSLTQFWLFLIHPSLSRFSHSLLFVFNTLKPLHIRMSFVSLSKRLLPPVSILQSDLLACLSRKWTTFRPSHSGPGPECRKQWAWNVKSLVNFFFILHFRPIACDIQALGLNGAGLNDWAWMSYILSRFSISCDLLWVSTFGTTNAETVLSGSICHSKIQHNLASHSICRFL
jgi:hypothetical protein